MNKGKDGYFGSVCMAGGWPARMNDEEEDWLMDKIKYYVDNYGIIFSACGDSFGGGDLIYTMQNSAFPKNTDDYFNFPPDPFPNRYD